MNDIERLRGLIELYDECPADLRAEALQSYFRYNSILKQLASRYGASVETAAAVFSALSPNNDYIGNLRDAATVLKYAQYTGCHPDDFKVSTYDQNKKKAWRIATRETSPGMEFEKRTSLKTFNFFVNCWQPEFRDFVTIDGHMYWAWAGRRGVVKTRSVTRAEDAPPSIGPTLYKLLSDAVKFVAHERGVIPNQAQAVIWQWWRVKHNILGTRQMELLASDLIVAKIDSIEKLP